MSTPSFLYCVKWGMRPANALFNFGVMILQESDITFTLFKVKDYKQ